MKEHILAAQAIGDALGVPYEGRPPTPDIDLVMSGGGLGDYEPAEYSDDTQMAVAIARAGLRADLRTEAGLAAVAEEFVTWVLSNPPDIGVQTAAATRGRHQNPDSVLAGMRSAALEYRQRHPSTSAGNGALMRTSVLGALPYSRDEIAGVAASIAAITHPDPLCVQSCVLWAEAVRLAASTGELDLTAGLDLLEPDARDAWAHRIATAHAPESTDGGGFTVTCLQRAWWAVSSTQTTPEALEMVVRGGGDTDTVAAVAGGLCGALRGLADIPADWLDVHGWPDLDLDGLVDLNRRLAEPLARQEDCAAPPVRGRLSRWLRSH